VKYEGLTVGDFNFWLSLAFCWAKVLSKSRLKSTRKPSYRWLTRATRKPAKNCSNSTLNFGLSPDFSIQLKVSFSERLSQKLVTQCLRGGNCSVCKQWMRLIDWCEQVRSDSGQTEYLDGEQWKRETTNDSCVTAVASWAASQSVNYYNNQLYSSKKNIW